MLSDLPSTLVQGGIVGVIIAAWYLLIEKPRRAEIKELIARNTVELARLQAELNAARERADREQQLRDQANERAGDAELRAGRAESLVAVLQQRIELLTEENARLRGLLIGSGGTS